MRDAVDMLKHAPSVSITMDTMVMVGVLDQPNDAPGLPPNTMIGSPLWVMHHIYGYERRLNLLKMGRSMSGARRCADCESLGFRCHAKWDKKQLPWADYCDEYGINSELIEPEISSLVGAER